MEEEPELVCHEAAARHAVCPEPVFHFFYVQFAVSAFTVYFLIEILRCVPVHVGDDEAYVLPDGVTLNLYDDPLRMSPFVGTVHEAVVLLDVLSLFPIPFLHKLHPCGDTIVKTGIAGDTCDEVDAFLAQCPLHEFVRAEHAVTPHHNLRVLPVLAQEEDDAADQPVHVGPLVRAAGTQQRQHELAADALEHEKRHVAVSSVEGVEERELLGTVGVGIAVVKVDDDLLRLLVV